MPSVDPIQEAKDKADKEAAAAAIMVSSCAAMPHIVPSLTLSLLSHHQYPGKEDSGLAGPMSSDPFGRCLRRGSPGPDADELR